MSLSWLSTIYMEFLFVVTVQVCVDFTKRMEVLSDFVYNAGDDDDISRCVWHASPSAK